MNYDIEGMLPNTIENLKIMSLPSYVRFDWAAQDNIVEVYKSSSHVLYADFSDELAADNILLLSEVPSNVDFFVDELIPNQDPAFYYLWPRTHCGKHGSVAPPYLIGATLGDKIEIIHPVIDGTTINELPLELLGPGSLELDVIVPVDCIESGTLPSGVNIDVTQINAGTLPSGVNMNVTQINAGTLPSNVKIDNDNIDGTLNTDKITELHAFILIRGLGA